GGMGRGLPGQNNANPLPLPVPKVAHAVGILAGNSSGLALLQDGTVMGWGGDIVSAREGGDYRRTWTPVVMTRRY
ncbi:MAG TPA: hypothetical protein VKQ52_02335, partial [Puia sp.]|nr:hypothetical protein [Puia sp.]